MLSSGLVVDLFAGGGGASVGIRAAVGREPDIAINHDAVALAVHRTNHPATRHLEADIWEVRPREATRGVPVALLWCSPDCRDHSNAKAGKPRTARTRSLAWAAYRWAREVAPQVIFLENVPEFEGWGPLGADGRRCKTRKGKTFKKFVSMLRNLGYVVDWRVLDASLYGAPTRRRRLFMIARRDGRAIVWPDPTHGPGRLPLRTAGECIDWSLPCPSIFERKRPLAEKTLWRIAQGLRRFVFESAEPFIVKVNHGKREARSEPLNEPLTTVTATQRGHALVTPFVAEPGQRHGRGQNTGSVPLTTIVAKDRHALVAPTLIQSGYGERPGQRARTLDLDAPLGTVVGCGQKHALIAAFLNKHYGDPRRSDGAGGVVLGSHCADPIGTVTSRDHHSITTAHLCKLRGQCHSSGAGEPLPSIAAGGGKGGGHVAEVRAFLTAYYGSDGTSGQDLRSPARTLTAKHRLGLVTVAGIEYQIVDIGFRMLEPHELLRAQFGTFAEDYDLGAAKTKRDQVRLIGNSVPPEVVEQLVRANTGDLAAAA